MDNATLIAEIRRLKTEKNAVVLAHNYQKKEIFEVADFMGDSLGLCLEARKTDADVIVFCGVHFMAESAKLINPTKQVLLPVIDAGCAMSDMITADMLRELKVKYLKEYPDLAVVAYVNTSAEVKSESDICCTSSNAVEIVNSLNSKHILFIPDVNLAKFVQKQVPDKVIIPFEGYCPIHHRIDAQYIRDAKKAHPKAKVIAHPECRPEVINLADYVCSTSAMISTIAQNTETDEFIVVTECGMSGRLAFSLPGKRIYSVCNMCFDMKKTGLTDVYESLLYGRYEITILDDIALKASDALNKMLAL